MNKTELRAWLYKQGIKTTTLTDEGAEKIQEWMDAPSQEKKVEHIKYAYTGISIATFLIGILIGTFI